MHVVHVHAAVVAASGKQVAELGVEVYALPGPGGGGGARCARSGEGEGRRPRGDVCKCKVHYD